MKLALFGYGGHAREIALQIGKPVVYFVDDQYTNKFTLPISLFDPMEYMLMIAIGNSNERRRIVKSMPAETQYFSFIHPSALIMDDTVKLGCGSFVGAYSILTTTITIGEHAILNRGNQVGHDTMIGDYFSAMPGAIVSGNVTIGNNVYLGTNSSIIEKITVTSDVTIGANAVVSKDINESGIYVGVPAKKK